MTHNILITLSTFLLVLISSFAMYLPFTALIKDRVVGLRYAIPLSISIEIIIGYIFYCLGTVEYFPISYLIIVLLANIWAYSKLEPLKFKKIRPKWTMIIAISITLVAVIYTRYYDSFKFVGPGANDAYHHLNFIKDLIRTGYLNNGFYAPGFHLFLMPVAKLIPFPDLYRFAGPAIGIVNAIFFGLLFKDYLKNKILLIFLFVLLALPIYNQFTLQTIGFFSSSLSFIYLASFIFLASDKDIKERKINLSFFLIFSVALALTVPYLFVEVFPAFLIFLFMVLFFKKSFKIGYSHYLFLINVILVLGFAASFGHVYIQSKILKRYSGFPGIAITYSKPDGTQVDTSNEELADNLHLPRFIENNRYLRSIVGTGYDLAKIKNIRPANSVLGLGAYLWIACSFFLLFYALRKKNAVLLAVAVLSIFFGLCTQTGMFEMSNYRGRSGWYLLMFSIFGLVIFVDHVYQKKMLRWFLAICIILSATGFFLPPKFYRSYYDEEFRVVSQIARQYSDKNITLITNNHQLDIVAENITIQRLIPDFLQNDNPVLMIEKEMLYPDPVLSQGAASTDKNFIEFNKQFEAAKEQLKADNNEILSSEQFKNFKKFFENEEFTIYENFKKD